MIGRYIALPCTRCDHAEGYHNHQASFARCALCTLHGGPCADGRGRG